MKNISNAGGLEDLAYFTFFPLGMCIIANTGEWEYRAIMDEL